MKKLPLKSIKAHTLEFAFMHMLNTAANSEHPQDIIETLMYWYKVAYKKELESINFDKNLIHKIRSKLLENNNIKNPILKENEIWEKIYECISR